MIGKYRILLAVVGCFGSIAVCPADLVLIEGKAKIVGNQPWEAIKSRRSDEIHWEKSWAIKKDRLITPVACFGTTNTAPTQSELNALLNRFIDRLVPPANRKTIQIIEGQPLKSDPVLNAGGMYIFNANGRYISFVIGMTQEKSRIVMILTIFNANKKESIDATTAIMGAFRFQGKPVFQINQK